MISERTLRVLEFTRVREMLAEGALTEIGAEKCRTLVPFDTLAEAEQAQIQRLERPRRGVGVARDLLDAEKDIASRLV